MGSSVDGQRVVIENEMIVGPWIAGEGCIVGRWSSHQWSAAWPASNQHRCELFWGHAYRRGGTDGEFPEYRYILAETAAHEVGAERCPMWEVSRWKCRVV